MASTLPHKDDMPPTYCPEKAQRLTESAPKRTMSSRRLAVTFFLCFMVAYGLAAAISPRYRVPCHYGHHEQVPEGVAGEPQEEVAAESALSTLLNSVSPDSLHRILHDYFPDRYQHGVYETDRQAVEAVHADNPAIVATIAQIAKRQNNSTTTSTSPPRSSTTSENPTSTTKPTTTSEEPKTSTPSNTSKAPTSTTTKAPETTESTTTSASPTRRSSSLVTSTFTSTQSNGDVTVVTATSFVEVGPSATATTGTGSLQTGNAAPGSPVPPPAWAGILLGGLLLI